MHATDYISKDDASATDLRNHPTDIVLISCPCPAIAAVGSDAPDNVH